MRAALLLLLLLACAAPLAWAETGSIWRVQRVILGPEAAMSEEQAAAWQGKPARIGQTSISFEGRTCRVTPEISRVELGVFLAAQQATPQELELENGTAELVDTGCDIPGFQTMLALPDGRFVSLHKGAFIFFAQQAEAPGQEDTLQEFTVAEAGLSLRLPAAVRALDPGGVPEQGLGFWYEAAPLHELSKNGPSAYPFRRGLALLDRAALAAATRSGADAADDAPQPPNALPASLRLLDLSKALAQEAGPAWGRTYARLQAGDTPCDLRFELVLVLYHAGWVVQAAIAAAPQTVVQENPGYFAPAACSDGTAGWEQGMQMAFWSMMQNERGTGLAQEWQQAFATMLASLELRQPWERPSFLAQDHEVCRSLAPAVWEPRYPGATLLPEQTFALAFPYGGFRQEPLCLLTLQQDDSQQQALTAAGRLLQPLGQMAPGLLRTRGLGVEDVNADGLPDVLVVADRLPDEEALQKAPEAARQPANRLHVSRPDPGAAGGVRWLLSKGYSAALRRQPTVPDARVTLRGLRRELAEIIGSEWELQGVMEEQFGQLVFVPRSLQKLPQGLFPQGDQDAVRWLLHVPGDLQDLPAPLREPGAGLRLRARILAAENALAPVRLWFQALDYASVLEFDFSGVPAVDAPEAPADQP